MHHDCSPGLSHSSKDLIWGLTLPLSLLQLLSGPGCFLQPAFPKEGGGQLGAAKKQAAVLLLMSAFKARYFLTRVAAESLLRLAKWRLPFPLILASQKPQKISVISSSSATATFFLAKCACSSISESVLKRLRVSFFSPRTPVFKIKAKFIRLRGSSKLLVSWANKSKALLFIATVLLFCLYAA